MRRAMTAPTVAEESVTIPRSGRAIRIAAQMLKMLQPYVAR